MTKSEKKPISFPEPISHLPDLSKEKAVSEALRLTEKLINNLADNKDYTKALIDKQLSRDDDKGHVEFTSGEYDWTVQLNGSGTYQNWHLTRFDKSKGELQTLDTGNYYTETEPHPDFPSIYVHPEGLRGIIAKSRILVSIQKRKKIPEFFDNCTGAVNLADKLLDSLS